MGAMATKHVANKLIVGAAKLLATGTFCGVELIRIKKYYVCTMFFLYI